MQVFRRPVTQCRQGDRAGICVTHLDPKGIERSLACTPGTVPTFRGAIASVEKVRFYSGSIASKSKVLASPQRTS
jgi:selenocysteine-specific elongation factor